MFKSSHCPDGKVADVLAPTHACTTANASVNYRGCVPQRPVNFPSPQWGKLLTCLPRLTLAQLRLALWSTTVGTCRRDLEFPHRPKGKLKFCSLLAGRWCLCQGRHSGHLIVHHQWEHSSRCARSYSKVPNASMTCSRLDSRLHNCERFGQLQWVRATETLKIYHRPHGRLMFCSLFAGRRCL